MKRIFERICKLGQSIIGILLRLILGVAYYFLFFPLGIITRICTDFLHIKKVSPSWVLRKKIDNIQEFLSHQ